MTTQNKRLTGMVLSVPILLLIPLLTNQFTDSEGWSLSDFVLMGGMLLGIGLLCEVVLRKVKNIEHRLALCGGLLLILFLIWAELSVGVFGTPFAGS
ncbi:MAG: hypothetical protein JWP69_981 [Flaviaesturariibacter sp.]|nr:hypothetical protein [Flaviaesturariibacter sp.]